MDIPPVISVSETGTNPPVNEEIFNHVNGALILVILVNSISTQLKGSLMTTSGFEVETISVGPPV